MAEKLYATFPLDCQALNAANEAVWTKHPDMRGKKIPMDREHGLMRKEWMEAYIAAGGKYQLKEPRRNPGDPVTTCGPRRPSQVTPKPIPSTEHKAKLLVIVLDSVTGKSVDYANVEITGPDSRAWYTDANGEAEFKELTPGDYKVEATKDGYTYATIPFHADPDDPDPSVTLQIATAGRLTVTVVREDNGQPIPQTRVRVSNADGVRGRGETNDQGIVDFDGLGGGEYQVEAEKLADKGQEEDKDFLPGQIMAKVSPAATETATLPLRHKDALIDEIAKQHKIVRRNVWGRQTPKYGEMKRDWDYKHVVIHHSGDSGETDPTQIESKHMNKRGFSDVGYHFLIAPNGTIYEGRNLKYLGAHTVSDPDPIGGKELNLNGRKIGILIMGDFEHQVWDSDDDPTQAQLNAATSLIKTLKARFPTLNYLGGHRDYKPSTECPGTGLYFRLKDMRTETGLSPP